MGSDLLPLLDRPASVSALWDRFVNEKKKGRERITFDWFSLALAALFAMGLVEWTASGQLNPDPPSNRRVAARRKARMPL
ncbi:hypothetical protein E9529_17510 [Blastococcus sp. KM273128]|nr:hypothetical protein [Blastococcus sp. KM273128]